MDWLSNMRSHRLENLPLLGREAVLEVIPNFDFYLMGLVERISLAPADESAERYVFNLTAKYSSGEQEQLVSLRFLGAQRVRLPELAPSFWLSELEIEDISSHQMENIRFRAKSFGMADFEVLCQNIEVALC